MKIEYKVKPVTRYIITRYHEMEVENATGETMSAAGCETRGEYDNEHVALMVANALGRSEEIDHKRIHSGMYFTYPDQPDQQPGM